MGDWKISEVEEVLPALRRYARALTKDAGEVDDLVQDALLHAYERAETFQPNRSLRAWLLSILRDRFMDDRRRQALERSHRDDPVRVDARPAPPSDPEHSLYLRQVARRFASLPDEQRAVLHLVAVEGLTYGEAAAALGLPIGTVMSRLNRARERMRRSATEAPEGAHLRIVGRRDER